MFFKKSTRSIVAGKRPRAFSNDLGQELNATENSVPGGLESPRDGKTCADASVTNPFTLPRWAYWAAGSILIVISIGLALLIPQASNPTPPVPPELQAGQTVISVQSDAALASLVSPGDIVQLYAEDGTMVEQLQYLQVYQPAADGCLLLLVDNEQAGVIVSQEISSKVVLICHDNADRAEELLTLQERINDPQITLELQDTVTLAPGESLELDIQAGIEPAEAILPQIQWQSEDPSVAQIGDGLVLAVGVGQTTITATCGNVQATCIVTIEIPLLEIDLEQTQATLAVGESLVLNTRLYPEDATNCEITWNSSDPAVATVSADGTITGVAPRTVTITATSGELTAECTITVGYHAETAKLDRETISLAIGQKYKLVASISPGEDLIDTMEYTSSNPKVATVDKDGTVTAVAAGNAIITFRCGDITVKCTVTVTPSTP